MQTVLVGLVNVVFTVFALLLIDRVGRRPLLHVRHGGHGALHAAGGVWIQSPATAR